MKYLTIYLYIVTICCCLVSNLKGQTKTLSLSDCIRMAITNNPTLLRSELNIDRADLQHKQARYDRLPQVNGGLSHELSQGRSIDPTTNQYVDRYNSYGNQYLSANVPLFNGFAILHNIRRRANAKEAGKLEFEGARNELKLDVIEAYLKVLTAQDMLTQIEGQIAVTKEQLHRHEVLNREGAVAPGDLYDIKGQYNSDLNLLEQTKQSLNDAELTLATFLNIPVAELPALEKLETEQASRAYNAEDLFRSSLTVLPEYRALDWRMKEMEENIKLMKSEYYPSLSLGAGLGSNYSKDGGEAFNQIKNNLRKSVSLSLTIPIFNRFATRTNVRMAQVDFNEAVLNKSIRENELRMNTAKAVFDLRTAQTNVQNLKEQEKSYQEAFRIANVHFEAGNSNSVIYLTAKNKLDNTRSQLVIKQYEWLLQKYINDYYAGALDL
ncbi:TolC family protein [Sphingobacterium sp.]|uniref:TolC family protein n=1 Tax=Sphingobacterium sp. TaxID=341027 RepID=UPI0028968091|nr:TolC family protein [Sphingobacterium sp.]